MPIEVNRDDLPAPSSTTEGGWPPDAEPRFVAQLALDWMREALEEGPRPRAMADKRFRHSDAGNCSRAVAYAALDLPASNPMDITGFWATGMGSLLHDKLAAALKSRYPGFEDEVVCILDGFEGSGHADAEVVEPGHEVTLGGDQYRVKRLIVGEWKTVGGFAYKLAVGERGAPKGPSWSYVVQGALNALARDADELVIGLLARDVISIQAAERKNIPMLHRFCAEWTLTREQFEPIARKEMARVVGILDLLDEGTLPKRTIPDPELPKRHVITDPLKGTWVETGDQGEMVNAGSTWHCAYCRWKDTCATTEAGRTPVTAVTIGQGHGRHTHT